MSTEARIILRLYRAAVLLMLASVILEGGWQRLQTVPWELTLTNQLMFWGGWFTAVALVLLPLLLLGVYGLRMIADD